MNKLIWILLIVTCVFLAGVSNGVMDTLQFHYGTSVFAKMDTDKQQYWQPSQSWKNKYKNYDEGDKSAAFPLSKTALVFLTDGWHLFQFFMLTFFTLAVLIGMYGCHLRIDNNWHIIGVFIVFAILKGLFSIGFHLMYSYFLTTT